ncbi:hypothetical protein JTB14_024439 [Gonioctena quinquepunctata]|nr:hypothetical protein JTB14_024439 [Gonioctena quinquepunctata]
MTDPMVYPLLFPCGDNGYSTGVRYNPRRGRPVDKTVTILQYYRYRLYIRDTFSKLHHGGKLFQQYIVDSWIKNEMNRLWWFREHQNDFRRTAEEALRRYNRSRRDGHVGKAIILPAAFPGGERYCQRQYLDAMTIVARFGKPDSFITFTCNPNWPEIKNNLMPYQKWENRPDLVCRVFQIKLQSFLDDLIQKKLYGLVINHQYVIEFQKRGLPHAHIVITFHEDDKLRTIENIDNIISAQIPDRQTQPLLHQRVKECQLHSPCGRLNLEASCVIDGKCSKFYPKPYREKTTLAVGHNKRPEYKRPADGREIYVERWNRSITNRRVIPYNPFALAKYNCHINFEAVGSLATMKYLHKYINKGPDSVTLYVDDQANLPRPDNNQSSNIVHRIDEIQQYIDGRYASAMEATWRLFSFKLHARSHSVLVLPVHLPGDRDLLYNEEDDIDEIEARLLKPSKLEAWFTLNQNEPRARTYRYAEIPEYSTWDSKNAKWNIRIQKSEQFGCIAEVSSSEGQIEKFFSRVLLKRIRGAISFDNLLTLDDGQVCETFREACQRRNWLVEQGGEFERCLREAELHQHPQNSANSLE